MLSWSSSSLRSSDSGSEWTESIFRSNAEQNGFGSEFRSDPGPNLFSRSLPSRMAIPSCPSRSSTLGASPTSRYQPGSTLSSIIFVFLNSPLFFKTSQEIIKNVFLLLRNQPSWTSGLFSTKLAEHQRSRSSCWMLGQNPFCRASVGNKMKRELPENNFQIVFQWFYIFGFFLRWTWKYENVYQNVDENDYDISSRWRPRVGAKISWKPSPASRYFEMFLRHQSWCWKYLILINQSRVIPGGASSCWEDGRSLCKRL